jgi:CelD/BcsL family acetyltransferase involved in cellulose biosynthesis
VRLWTAEKDGDLVAGALIFYWNAHAVYWHAAINRDYAGLAPGKPLLAAAIENACSDGYGYFDFSPSGGHDSVATFKARFGAEAWPVEHYRFERAPLRAARHLRESVTSIMRRSAPSALPSSGTAHRLSAGPRPT